MEPAHPVLIDLPPDPFKPVIGLKLGRTEAKSWSDYSSPYQRRAEILAATRRMLGEEGCERIMLKSISEACSITTQTLHNSFGSKAELLTAAMNQYTLMIDSHALAQTADPSVFLWLGRAYCRVAAEHPVFMREFVHATFSPKLPLREALMRYGTELKLQILRSLARRGLIRPFIDPRMAAEQIACVNTFAMLEWAENGDLKKLYERMIHGNGAILLGILTPDAGKDVETWLSGQFHPDAMIHEALQNSAAMAARPL